MKQILLIAFLSIGVLQNGYSQTKPTIADNIHKILFLGNSITYSGQYVSYVEAYLKLQYPKRKWEFINIGLPSETVSGLSEPNHAQGKFPRPDLRERLQRILSMVNPELVFANYGINDGIYLPYDDFRFQKFKDGILWMHDEVIKTGANIIHLTPPVYDGIDADVYDNVMNIYSDWLISRRNTANWKIIDIHSPMKRQLKEQRTNNPNFKFAPDGVHPNHKGHWVMAQQLLLGIGEKNVEQYATIEDALSSSSYGKQILGLVEKRQILNRDAWLTATEHTRPGLAEGIPLKEAIQKAILWEKQIQNLLEQ